MSYEARWYLCDLADEFERPEEPDWSKVPEAKREMVRARWLAKETPVVRTYLWGPQIEWFARQPQHAVTVLECQSTFSQESADEEQADGLE